MKINRPLGCLGLEIGGLVTDANRHSDLLYKTNGMTRAVRAR